MADESVLFESRGAHLKSKFKGTFGRIELTPDRIIFYRTSPLLMMFGLIGALLSLGSKGTATLEIEFTNVKEFERQKQGLTTKVLGFTMNDGSSHRLKIDKFDSFLTELIYHLTKYYSLSHINDNHWAVEAKQ